MDSWFLCFGRASHLGLLYLGSLLVLLVYSILYGLTAKEAHWLGSITSAAVIILGILFSFVIDSIHTSMLTKAKILMLLYFCAFFVM